MFPQHSVTTGEMSIMSKNRTMPLFVNSSQMQKYGCSPAVSPADKSADHRNIFGNFSILQDTYTTQSTRACANDTENSKSASPVFGRQRPMMSLSGGQNLMMVDCDTKTPSSTEADNSDVDSPVVTVRSRKRRRFHRCRILTDSDSSDGESSDCSRKVHKSSPSYYNENNELTKNKAVATSGAQRLSDLEHRHCFDLLLSHERNSAVTNSSITQSAQKWFDERLKRSDASRDSVKCSSPSPCESLDGDVESDRATGNAIHSASDQCSVRLRKLQLRDVSPRIVLSQEDRLSLSGKHSSTVGGESSTVNSNNRLSASADLINRSEVVVNNSSVLQPSDVHLYSSDDLFSDNEAVESVCLSPSLYCSPGEQKDDTLLDISQPLDKSLESAVMSKQSEVPFVSYSQAEDDCILIDDSDDELFANLTQNDITIKVEDDDERHHSDDHEEFVIADDGKWMQDDVVAHVTAAASRNCVREMPVALEPCDPWINDVADVSSDELEEAYDAAMSYAHQAEAHHTVSASSTTDSENIHHYNHDPVVIANMRQQCTTSPCKVSLKRLRMVDIPPQIHLSQEDKHLCEPDVVHVDYESDDSHSDVVPDSVSSVSISSEVNADTTYADLCHGDNNILAVSEDVCEKPQDALASSDFTESVGSEKLAGGDTLAAPKKEAVSGVLPIAKDAVFDEWHQVSPGRGNFEEFNEATSVQETKKVTKNAEVKGSYDKGSTRPQIALEHCVEVAEFYGTRVPPESRWHQQESSAVKSTMNVDKCADMNNKDSSGLSYLNKDKSRLTLTAPHHLKHRKTDTIKLGGDSALKQDEWKSKSLLQSSSTGSSVQCHKISQMRDYGKQKLRRDKTSLTGGIQDYDSHDRFQGLSQFSVAKQQLVERNRQLKAIGLYCCC